MFAIEMLPALDGDCLLIEYGSPESPRRILIDGGPIGGAKALAERIERIGEPGEREFELLVVTHLDSDHIAGMLKLLKAPPEGFHAKQAWFNAYPQLAPGMLGAKEGEFLAVHFNHEDSLRPGYWNGAFSRGAVGSPRGQDLRTVELDGGFKLTVLAPDEKALAKLRDEWEDVVSKYFEPGDIDATEEALKKDKRYRPGYLGGVNVNELADEPFREDTSVANGSSIVLLAEYEGHRCLLAADTFPSTIMAALSRLDDRHGSRLNLSLVKVPHHGSMKNNSKDLYRVIDCPRYLISTDGSKHCHPHPQGVARILATKRGHADIYFNYRSDCNQMWLDRDLQNALKYTPHFPADGETGLRIEL
jgi:beta-lactamase superfamily II metal-dependent hydrolase